MLLPLERLVPFLKTHAAINVLLLLFLESVHSVAMIKDSMNVVQATTQHLNPGQVSIIAADQLLPSRSSGTGQPLWEKITL